MTLTELNQEFGIENHIAFRAGNGELPKAVITTPAADAEIYLHGGHVTHYQGRNDPPLLWMSEKSIFDGVKAIRGGVPVCWPWFGPHPQDSGKPQHGFARTLPWDVTATAMHGQDCAEIRLTLNDSDATRVVWPHPFELELKVLVSHQLRLELKTTNTGAEPITIGGALHTYFTVWDIADVEITGLEDTNYIDLVDRRATKKQEGPVKIFGEVDRTYLDNEKPTFIHDPGLQRIIRVAREGSQTVVVWNPWAQKAATMADFPPTGYERMVCVEAVNTGPDDLRTLDPGESHTLTQILSVE